MVALATAERGVGVVEVVPVVVAAAVVDVVVAVDGDDDVFFVAFASSVEASKDSTLHSPSSQSTDSVSAGTDRQSTPPPAVVVAPRGAAVDVDVATRFAIVAFLSSTFSFSCFFFFLVVRSGLTAETTAEVTAPATSSGVLSHLPSVAAAEEEPLLL